MTDVNLPNGEQSAEFTLPTGCLACGGPVSIRITPGHARGYCVHCHWVSKPEVEFGKEGIRVGHSLNVLA